jgi:hypothetical protein
MSQKGKRRKKYQEIRKRYQDKRHSSKWKIRKKNKQIQKELIKKAFEKYQNAPYREHIAPKNFSFINNTDEVLKYFDDAHTIFESGDNVTFEISEVDEMTPDTLALLIASIKNPKFRKRGNSRGNEPEKPKLQKMFRQSGFNEQVTSSGFPSVPSNHLLHKEVHNKVEPRVAKKACITGLKHIHGVAEPFPPLYEILIECMSNSHNHASLNDQGECRWWLYVFTDPDTKSASYTFVDLGVGIFKSAYMAGKINEYLKGTIAVPHLNLVDNLLAGKIQSRIEKDRPIRGKGIPQITRHAKMDCFSEFYIITNDVKIDLKTGKKYPVAGDFSGTLLHWTLINNYEN